MIKKCYVLDGKIINIGEWDYKKTINEQGEEIINNPLPEDATEENRDFEYSEERGWYEVGTIPQPTQEELLKQELTKTNAMVLELTEIILGGM